MEEKVVKLLKQGKSVAIVGASDSGKTYFVCNKLIPRLKAGGLKVLYFAEGDLIKEGESDVVVFDEVETLFDQERIENKEGKLYDQDYLEKVKDWGDKYKTFSSPAVFVISRNEEDIEYLSKNLENLAGRDCVVFPFRKDSES